jgi:hypothetical protein
MAERHWPGNARLEYRRRRMRRGRIHAAPDERTLRDGRKVGYWVRVSNACQRIEGRWLITHEHVSLPVDLQSAAAVMDLAP